MIFLVNDWYWRDKSHPLEAMQAFARMKQETGVPLDSFTLDDGWDFDWDEATGVWGRLSPKRFPGGWESLLAAGRPADIGVSLWFGPIGGYGATRKKRLPYAQTLGFEINGDRLCLAGPRYQKHVTECFSRWAAQGMDYIKVDGFWPNCEKTDHGHATGPGGEIQQMDVLMRVFARGERPIPSLSSATPPAPIRRRSGCNIAITCGAAARTISMKARAIRSIATIRSWTAACKRIAPRKCRSPGS